MTTKYRNPASVAQERVLELSAQWNRNSSNSSASYNASSNDDQSSSGKQKPGKGLIKETRSSRANYAEEEDARLGNPDAEWKSGYAHSDKSSSDESISEDEKARRTQTKGGKPEKYAKEEDDSLAPEETGAPTKEATKKE